MEKYLLKAALYAFLLGLALGVLLVPDTSTVYSGSTAINAELPLRTFILDLLRFAVRILFAGVALALLWRLFGRSLQSRPSFLAGYLKGFALTAAVLMLLLFAASAFSLL